MNEKPIPKKRWFKKTVFPSIQAQYFSYLNED